MPASMPEHGSPGGAWGGEAAPYLVALVWSRTAALQADVLSAMHTRSGICVKVGSSRCMEQMAVAGEVGNSEEERT